MRIHRERTALRRAELSRPVKIALDLQLLAPGISCFDFGCGHGGDVRGLRALGLECHGWDPAHQPNEPRRQAAVVNLGYVINVIESHEERAEALVDAWNLAQSLLIVSARLLSDVDEVRGATLHDGVVTRCGTFQKFFTQTELKHWIESILEVPAVSAAPGIFLVFRGDEARERFIASRFRTRLQGPRVLVSAAMFEQHRQCLEPLMTFFTERGRLPSSSELTNFSEVQATFGTIGQAFAVVRRATEPQAWERIAAQRGEELLLYLAYSQFNRPPRLSELAPELRNDIRSFHGNYQAAQAEAVGMMRELGDQDLIDATCRTVTVGKQTPQAVYIHRTALSRLPTLLRLYEACARGLVGDLEDANIIKLHRYRPQVSYLTYDRFDQDGHPPLRRSTIVNLDEAKASFRDYSGSGNPPILHRKEEFVPDDYPTRAKFVRLTRSEERAGLYESPSTIGHLREWRLALEAKGLHLRGHRLTKRTSNRSS